MKNEILTWPEEVNAMNITLEQLKGSTAIQDFGGKLSKRAPLKHHAFLDMILNTIKVVDDSAIVSNIYVAKNKTKHIELLDPDDKGFLKATAFTNIIAEILVPTYGDDEKTMKYAIQYNDKGISMYSGTNISVCSNFTVLGSSQRISTSGRTGMPYDKMLQVFSAWVSKMKEAWTVNNKVIEELKSIELSGNGQIQELVGDLLLSSVNQAYNGGTSPFTISDVSKFSLDLLKNKEFIDGSSMTAWDLLNFGTEILGTNQNNIDSKLEQLLGLSEFIIQKYNPSLSEELNSVYIIN